MGQIEQLIINAKTDYYGKAETVAKIASQNMFYDMVKPIGQGGRMRVDTGFMRASARASLGGPLMQTIKNPNSGVNFDLDTGQVILTINRLDASKTLHIGFVANYAIYREYGANGQPPDAFVRTPALNWQSYVNDAVRDVRGN